MSILTKMQKITLIFAFICNIVFIFLLSLAIYFYPGGTRFDKFTESFSFLKNFISDLGQVIAENDHINIISRILFITGIVIFSISQIIFSLNVPIILIKNRISLIFSIIALATGIVFAGLYIGIAFNSHDINPNLHNKLIYSAAPMVFISSLFLTIAMFLSKIIDKFYSYIILSLIIIFAIFAIITAIGTQLDHDINWSIRILGHTILIYTEALIYGILAIGFYNHIRKTTNVVDFNKKEVIKTNHTKI